MVQQEQAGAAWSARARDWAYLMESWLLPVYERVFEAVDVRAGTRLLDVACGSGLATMIAAARGATVAGLDAAPALIRIAASRTPEGDFRTGDMNSLPFDDASFDVVTSFNGIWYGWDAALAEARRTARRGGHIALSFWGSPKRMGHWPWFALLAQFSTAHDTAAVLDNAAIGKPGVAEEMFERAGITVTERGAVQCWSEFPDAETAWRGLASAGPSWPAVEADEAGYRAAMLETLEPLVQEGVGIRLGSEIGYVIGRVPAS